MFGAWVGASPFVAVACVAGYAASGHFRGGADFLSVLAAGLMAGGAALLLGAVLGFLFGLPRTTDRGASHGVLATNTNLDQISDWLTKILVGIGLVQLGKFAHGTAQLAKELAPALGGTTTAKPLGVGLLVYCFIDGFLLGYLWTRIVASRRLKEAAEDLEQAAQATDILLSEALPSPPPTPPPPPPVASGVDDLFRASEARQPEPSDG